MKKNSSLLHLILLLTAFSCSHYELIAAIKPNNYLPQKNSKTGFIENKGQIINQNNKPNPSELYLLNTPGFNVQLRASGWSYDLIGARDTAQGSREDDLSDHASRITRHDSSIEHRASSIQYHRIDITLLNADPNCKLIPSGVLPDYFNYYTAACPSEGVKNVRQYGRIIYENIYPDIDLEFFTDPEHNYKYNFVIRPGGNINDIRLKIDGPDQTVVRHGTLKFRTRFGNVEELIPESYYFLNNSKVAINAGFQKINNEFYGFTLDRSLPENSELVIDPTAIRLWGTYYGGTNDEELGQCSVDNAGDVYLAGFTNSSNNIASIGSYQDTLTGSYDGFLIKFNAAGQRLWGTYFGGTSYDELSNASIIIDKSANIYISGNTRSTSGIASPGAHQTIFGGGQYDCFIEKFSQAGNRIWGTYYGGAFADNAGNVTVDKNGNIFLSGQTASDTGIATSGSYQPNRYNNSVDAFLAKFDSNGVRQWGTYYGGESNDLSEACTTDGSGNVFFCGLTNSQINIASPGAFQTIYGGGTYDAYLVKFSPGGQRDWATYYGGSNEERGFGCTANNAGEVCLVGETNSPDAIGSTGCYQPVLGGMYDAFIVKFDSLGQRLWGTYYGGPDYDIAYSCTFGWNNYIFLVGCSKSTNKISTPNSYQPVLAGPQNGMLVKFDTSGQRQWGTYYGGNVWDWFLKCSYVKDDTLYLAGGTESSNNIASQGAWQQILGGGQDGMLIKFLDCWPIDTAGPIIGPVNVCKPSAGVSYSIPSLDHAVNYVWTLPSGFTISTGSGTNQITLDIDVSAVAGNIWVKGMNKCGESGDSALLVVNVNTPPSPVINGPNNTCAGTGKVYLTATGKTNYQWSVSAGGVITLGGSTTDNTATVTWNTTGTQHVYVNYADANGCSAAAPTDFVVLVTPSPVVDITINASATNVCSGTLVTFTATPVNGGGVPSFLWKVNGLNVGGNTPVYSYTPLNNDVVTCELTSSITGCIMNNPATSNSIPMTVIPNLPVSVTIAPNANPVCAGTCTDLTATVINGGTSPTFQWLVNGNNVYLSNSNLTNGLVAYYPFNGNANDASGNGNNGTVNGAILSNDRFGNTNSAYNFNGTTDIINCGHNSSLQLTNSLTISTWFRSNGSSINGEYLISKTTTPGNYEYCIAVVDLQSVSQLLAAVGGTNFVEAGIGINPTINIWHHVAATFNFPGYLIIYYDGTYVDSTVTTGAILPTAQDLVIGCIRPSGEPTIRYFTGDIDDIRIYNRALTDCEISQLYLEGTSSFSLTPNNGDLITCTVNSNAICTANNPSTSPPVSITVNPNLPVSITITASQNPFCLGSSVTFTATPTNGGTTPSYLWKVNGINAGTNSPNFSYIPANNDQVFCILNSSELCTSGNPASSVTITMIQNNSLPAGVTISASANPFCPGSSVTFTASPVNGGTTPSYQWKVNGINSGTNPTYTYNPVNGDSIRCIMTSNLSCVTGNPVSSSNIIMNGNLAPVVTFTSCFDTITRINAKPIKLKGGIPLGGTYSGPGVNSITGVFTPALAGVGTHTITYSYTNAALCTASKPISILNLPSSILNCGNTLTDPRDNKVYQTVQIGSQCWMAEELNYGTEIPNNQDQRDNCIPEKYSTHLSPLTTHSFYQWDELMAYDDTPADQGFCPPGWHIPSENDWNILFANYINSSFAGSPLKYSGYSGFNALLSGVRDIKKGWDLQGFATFFWSSTPSGRIKAWAHGMNEVDPSVSSYPSSRANAFSVRCLKD
jgi:uncharacterized protein (TIGR02145 family)